MAINRSIVGSDFNKQLPKLALSQTKKIVRRAFEKKKTEMIADFLNHPVTIEIKGGIEAKNITNTLNGITNLYSFIGFPKAEDPITPIVEVLQTTNLRFSRVTSRKIDFTAELPDPPDIWKVTPLPYNVGRSWARSIETGLSGLNFYLNKRKGSRSGLGVQSKKRIRSVKFRNIQYISAFLKKWRKEFENIEL
jgi:hypothetical protein